MAGRGISLSQGAPRSSDAFTRNDAHDLRHLGSPVAGSSVVRPHEPEPTLGESTLVDTASTTERSQDGASGRRGWVGMRGWYY